MVFLRSSRRTRVGVAGDPSYTGVQRGDIVIRNVLIPLFIVAALAPAAAWAECSIRLPTLVDAVSARLEAMDDFSADFVQFQEDALNQTYREEGHVYLRRNGRMMRWEYGFPEEKLFVVKGNTMHTYAPADRQVLRE